MALSLYRTPHKMFIEEKKRERERESVCSIELKSLKSPIIEFLLYNFIRKIPILAVYLFCINSKDACTMYTPHTEERQFIYCNVIELEVYFPDNHLSTAVVHVYLAVAYQFYGWNVHMCSNIHV